MKTSKKNKDEDRVQDCTSDFARTQKYDEEYIQKLESKNYSVSLPCLHERVVATHSITDKRDLESVEKSVRVILKCDFGNCIALETASYSRMRTRMLQLLRVRREPEPALLESQANRIQIAPNFLLEFDWRGYTVSLIEKPQQQEIHTDVEHRFFFLFSC
jgi:hypothetical protein